MTGEAMNYRDLDVAIYTGPASATLLRDRGGGRAGIRQLRWSTALPGGFDRCTFDVEIPAAATWPVDTGQKVVVRQGVTVLWWGWVEDVQRAVRGSIARLRVTALGPWQELQQRLIASVNYTSDQVGSSAIIQELADNCPNVSTNYSEIQASGVAIGPLTKAWWPVADLVKLVCAAGDAQGRALLFAIWEPPLRPDAVNVLRSRNVCRNPDFEGPDWYGWEIDASTNGDYEIITTTYVSASRSGKVFSTSAVAAGNVTLRNVYTDAVASAAYRFEFSYYFAALSNAAYRCRVSIQWFNSGGSTISVQTSSWYVSNGVAGWRTVFADFTAPANAAKMKCYVTAEWPAGTAYYVGWDNVYCSRMVTSEDADLYPRAHLWPRDLSDYDYVLWTALTEPVEFAETTRELGNYVVASYGSGSYTTAGEDAASQSLYRRRDHLLAAGSGTDAALAASLRDTWLEQYAAPLTDVGQLKLDRPGAVTTRRGRPVELTELRAGDRLLLGDGPFAGQVIMLTATEWADGVLRCTPESDYSLPERIG